MAVANLDNCDKHLISGIMSESSPAVLSNFAQKIENAFNGDIKTNVRFSANSEDISFSTDTNGEELVVMVIAVDKA